jgi:Na+/melibiose symporter-like transporter
MLVSAAAVGAMALVPRGDSGFGALLGLIVLRALGASALNVAPNALLGDVVDLGILGTGRNAAGQYNALVAMVTKANGAVGGGLGLVLIGLAGFSPRGVNSSAATLRFEVVTLALPALLLAGAAAAAFVFPRDRRRHDIVRRRILARAPR